MHGEICILLFAYAKKRRIQSVLTPWLISSLFFHCIDSMISCLQIGSFKSQASLWSCASPFLSDMGLNPGDRFSHKEAYSILNRKRKPDTFRLVLNRKVQNIELKTNTYFNSKTLKSTFKVNLFIKYRTLRYDVKNTVFVTFVPGVYV